MEGCVLSRAVGHTFLLKLKVCLHLSGWLLGVSNNIDSTSDHLHLNFKFSPHQRFVHLLRSHSAIKNHQPDAMLHWLPFHTSISHHPPLTFKQATHYLKIIKSRTQTHQTSSSTIFFMSDIPANMEDSEREDMRVWVIHGSFQDDFVFLTTL